MQITRQITDANGFSGEETCRILAHIPEATEMTAIGVLNIDKLALEYKERIAEAYLGT